jgi:hypothetical protein
MAASPGAGLAEDMHYLPAAPDKTISRAIQSGEDPTDAQSDYITYSGAVETDADWPMAGANPQRTSWTPEEVRGSLEPIWYRPIGPYIPQTVQIIAAYDTLYVATSRGLYALSTEDNDGDGVGGDVKWIYPTELPLGNSPTIHNGVAYISGLDHRIDALEADPDPAMLPVDPETGYRINDRVLWTFNAGAGFQTNPLVIDNTVDPSVPPGEGIVCAGNRDGKMYAIRTEGPNAGQVAWPPFQTDGPILFSAAYKQGVLYFASNDSYAYALDSETGHLLWKSAKLPGSGFHSWWPVLYTDPQTHADYIILPGSNNYRYLVEPGPTSDIQVLEIDDLYAANGIPLGDPVAPIQPDGSMDATLILEYYEQKPWRRTYFVLDAATGEEVTIDYQRRDGSSGTSFAPITWFSTHGPGNRYPPVVGSTGLLYQPMHFVSNPYIARGTIVGWQVGSSSVEVTGSGGFAMDEPVAYAAGGDLIYWTLCNDRAAGARDITMALQDPDRSWDYFSYDLPSMTPGYNELYSPTCWLDFSVYSGANQSSNGIYSRHGEQNPPIPYRGRVYAHLSNAIIAFGESSGPPAALPMVPSIDIDEVPMVVATSSELKARLTDEVQSILDAGHLRPGYLGSGIFDEHARGQVGSYLVDYWHSPSDILYALLSALPHLSEAQKSEVRAYLQSEFAAYPPYQYTHIGWRDGAAREAYTLPEEVESDLANFPPISSGSEFAGWGYPPHMFYALWKYAEEFGGAAEIFDSSRNRLETPPSDDYLSSWPQVQNAYIAGYLGFLELQRLAGYPESPEIRAELERLLSLRVSSFSKDFPFGCDNYYYGRELSVARNFMFLVPELAQYLRDHAFDAVSQALDEYNDVAPYWFVTKTEQTSDEGIIQPLYDSHAVFQARAMILRESRVELLKYLDVPAFARGDLFYIENLVAAIEAQPYLEKTPSAPFGYQGTTITYTLSLYSTGNSLHLTDTLPVGTSPPTGYDLEGTNVLPVYDELEHRLTWTDTPTSGVEVQIAYGLEIVTDVPGALVNTAELRDEEGRNASVSVTVMANPELQYLPLILRRY